MTSDEHATRGTAVSAALFGDAGTPHLDAVAALAPDLARYAVEFVFGEVYARPGLSLRDRQLVAVGALTALGDTGPQLAAHLGAALEVGLGRAELVEALIQTVPFAGFPRALQAVRILAAVPARAGAAHRGSVPIWLVDAFTAEPFAGNPAGVCLLPSLDDEVWMQAVAAELNLSETAFVGVGGDGDFPIRWFTPRTEVSQCGHATVAAAHTLWTEGLVPAGKEIPFTSASGPLTATRTDGVIWLDFPGEPVAETTDVPDGLVEALGVPVSWIGRNRFDWVVETTGEAEVRDARPDHGRLTGLPRGVSLTARAESPGYDYVSRFFAPAVGVNEDPVTGSAQCSLGPYWAGRLGRDALRCRQLSARGGDIAVRVVGDRVHFGGPAVTTLRGAVNR